MAFQGKSFNPAGGSGVREAGSGGARRGGSVWRTKEQHFCSLRSLPRLPYCHPATARRGSGNARNKMCPASVLKDVTPGGKDGGSRGGEEGDRGGGGQEGSVGIVVVLRRPEGTSTVGHNFCLAFLHFCLFNLDTPTCTLTAPLTYI